jgi:hypothetical protein
MTQMYSEEKRIFRISKKYRRREASIRQEKVKIA